jgi:hypothetical protein
MWIRQKIWRFEVERWEALHSRDVFGELRYCGRSRKEIIMFGVILFSYSNYVMQILYLNISMCNGLNCLCRFYLFSLDL